MLNIQGLDHIVLRTCNLEPMKAFYCEVLGCHVDKVNEEVGFSFYVSDPDGNEIEFITAESS